MFFFVFFSQSVTSQGAFCHHVVVKFILVSESSKVNAVNFQAYPIFRGFSDWGYYMLKKIPKFFKKHIYSKNRVTNHNFAKIFKLPKSGGLVLIVYVKNSAKITSLHNFSMACFNI